MPISTKVDNLTTWWNTTFLPGWEYFVDQGFQPSWLLNITLDKSDSQVISRAVRVSSFLDIVDYHTKVYSLEKEFWYT